MPSHLAFPIRVAGRGLATVDQDSDADLVQSVQLLLQTRPGERRSVPGYGLPDPLFGTAPDDTDVAAVIAEWEERVDIDQLDVAAVIREPDVSSSYGAGLYGEGFYGGTGPSPSTTYGAGLTGSALYGGTNAV